MKNKLNALEDFLSMIKKSWTWDKLTEEEKNKFVNDLYECPVYELKGTYKQRWQFLNACYFMYIRGLGYDPQTWESRGGH